MLIFFLLIARNLFCVFCMNVDSCIRIMDIFHNTAPGLANMHIFYTTLQVNTSRMNRFGIIDSTVLGSDRRYS